MQRSLSSHPVSLSLALLLGFAACSPAATGPGDTGGSGGVGGAGSPGSGGSGNSGTGGSGAGGSKGGSGGPGTPGTGGSTGSGGSGNTGTGGSGNTGTGGSGNTGTGGSGNTGAGGSGNTGTGGSGGGTGGTGMPGTVVDPPCTDRVDKMAPSINPPGGLMPNQVPQFVLLGYDDNAFVDGIQWTLDVLRDRKHPDGTAARATFFITAGFADEHFNPAGGQSKDQLINIWKQIKVDGHEIGSHTWSHSQMLAGLDKAGWESEIARSFDLFVNTLGIERCKLWGFRTPFLNFSQATFDAMKTNNVRYDTSVEFGYDWFQPMGSDKGYGPGTAEAGKHYYWPFTMDTPFPGGFASKGVGPAPGMWQFPVYTFNKITGETASTVTGFDFNLWNKSQSETGFNYTEVLKQSLDQRIAGNRSPFAVGLHTDVYSQFNESANTTWNKFDYMARRKALFDFIEYALTRPEVRLVTYRQLIEWLRQPKPL
jgi:peptidoglycan/xylan/chitin deacetylase (PgdA/CDA1 family)